jgi:hypothetical protein
MKNTLLKIKKNKTKYNKSKKNTTKLKKTKKLNNKFNNKINNKSKKRGGFTIIAGVVNKAILKINLNLLMFMNTLFNGPNNYEMSLENFGNWLKKHLNNKFIIKPELNLKFIYENFSTFLNNKKTPYDERDKIFIIILFIYKFYSINLVNKEYYGLWKNNDIEYTDTCRYKYFLYEIKKLWSSYSSFSSRTDDFEKYIMGNKKKNVNWNTIYAQLITYINTDYSSSSKSEIDEAKEYFVSNIFYIPKHDCNDIIVDYSYYILIILYYIYYTISDNKHKGLDQEIGITPINYDELLNSIDPDDICKIENTFIDIYEKTQMMNPKSANPMKSMGKLSSLSKLVPK